MVSSMKIVLLLFSQYLSVSLLYRTACKASAEQGWNNTQPLEVFVEWETQRSKTVAAPLGCPQSCHRHPEESLLTSSQGSVGRESLLEVKCGPSHEGQVRVLQEKSVGEGRCRSRERVARWVKEAWRLEELGSWEWGALEIQSRAAMRRGWRQGRARCQGMAITLITIIKLHFY